MTLHELALLAASLTKPHHDGGQGLWVFPAAADKRPCCAHGHLDAVDRPERAHRLFMAHPGARLVGVPMGIKTMLLGIDVDPLGLPWLRRNQGRFWETLTHKTPRGGYHLIFRLPGPPAPIIGCPQRNNGRPALAYGVDIKSEGGSLIWAPTPGYSVVCDAPVARLPKWILRRLTEKEKQRNGAAADPLQYRGPLEDRVRRIVQFIEYSRQGERNQRLFWGGCRAGELVCAGQLSERDAIDIVVGAAVRAGLPRLEALATARNGVRTGARKK